MLLYVVRHAYAGEHGDPRYPDDSKRPLTDRGRERFDRLVKRLVAGKFAPQAIGTSPYLRCRQTAAVLAERLPKSVKPEAHSEFSPGTNAAEVIRWCAHEGASKMAYVGHAPDVDWITAALLGARIGSLHFVKGAIAAIEFDDKVGIDRGLLRWFVSPKLFD